MERFSHRGTESTEKTRTWDGSLCPLCLCASVANSSFQQLGNPLRHLCRLRIDAGGDEMYAVLVLVFGMLLDEREQIVRRNILLRDRVGGDLVPRNDARRPL